VTHTRRRWLQAALWAACPSLRAARKEFWESKDPASWTGEEKEILLGQSPWARQGFARMDEKQSKSNGNRRGQSVPMPDTRPGTPPGGGAKSVPIGEPIPRAPKGGGEPVQFRVLARWETAKPVRLAGGPEVPEMTGQFYVIRLHGLPLMPPPKAAPGEAVTDPNEGMLQAIKDGSRLERIDKAAIPCGHLFTGSGNMARDVLLFFPRLPDPITIADKVVTLDSRFDPFRLEVKFPLKEMMFQGELAL
jgi:hypothetical protein